MSEENYFNCCCCGECCSGEMHVFLNPEDLCLIAEKTGCRNTSELFSSGVVVIDRERNDAPLPRIRFKEGIIKFCPFLENRIDEDGRLIGLCSLHPANKPLVCGLAPLFREVDIESGSQSWGFRPPHPGCPGCNIEKVDRFAYNKPTDIETLRRLSAEEEFFRRLEGLLQAGISEEAIIKELYYRDINCTH